MKTDDKQPGEPIYLLDNNTGDDSISRLINLDKDTIKFDEDVEIETINGAIEEILKRKNFWEKYSLLKGLDARYSDLFKELKQEKATNQLIKQIFNSEDLTIIEKEKDREIDLRKVEGLVQLIKNENIKEDSLRGAVPLLLSDKENEVFSVFYITAKKSKTVEDPRIIVSCIEGMLFMIHGLEDKLDQDRMDSIRDISRRYISLHLTPISIKSGFDYAKEMNYIHFMAEMIKYTGKIVDESLVDSPKRAVDTVRAIDLNINEFDDTDLNLSEIIDNHIIKKLIVAGKIMLASKLAQRYGVTTNPEKKEIYGLLLSIYEAQNETSKSLYEEIEL